MSMVISSLAVADVVEVPQAFHGFMDSAVVRLGYLYPDRIFEATGFGIAISNGSEISDELRRDVLHCVYREKVFAETLPLRRRLIDGLLGQ